ncbi:MAG: hypothetical protein K2X44_00630 [Magnetospirillum sp.]|nr:hypothetical protein [Magnetospirillum sp.]
MSDTKKTQIAQSNGTRTGEKTVDPLSRLLHSHPETAYDYLEFRRLLAGQASAFAAERATEEDLARLETCMRFGRRKANKHSQGA